MLIFEGIYAAANAARDSYTANADTLPAHMIGAIYPYTLEGQSWVDLICNYVESVYANKDLPEVTGSDSVGDPAGNMLEVAAGVGAVIAMYGFWDGLSGRVAGIILALRRDSGEEAEEGFPWPEPEVDPAPGEGYLPPA